MDLSTTSYLFEMLDTQNRGTVERDAALKVLREHISPGMSLAQLDEISRRIEGGNRLSLDQFQGLMRSCSFKMTSLDFNKTLTVVANGLRDARRRRFLMFADNQTVSGIDQETLALQLAGGVKSLSQYEEIYAYGMDERSTTLSKSQLEKLMKVIAPSQPPQELAEMLKVASYGPSGGVDFTEFLILMKGARLASALSDQVAAVRTNLAMGIQIGDDTNRSNRLKILSNEDVCSQHDNIRVGMSVTEARENDLRGFRDTLMTHKLDYSSTENDILRDRAERAERAMLDAQQVAAELSIASHYKDEKEIQRPGTYNDDNNGELYNTVSAGVTDDSLRARNRTIQESLKHLRESGDVAGVMSLVGECADLLSDFDARLVQKNAEQQRKDKEKQQPKPSPRFRAASKSPTTTTTRRPSRRGSGASLATLADSHTTLGSLSRLSQDKYRAQKRWK
eukprot:TRINITY_DN12166_c0_g1_i1.p1 TRINITY_DN12166_c0_g1~~TRINITY_DN12166_c0_g1_i1.p1  ORF type:complete len:451 (+),score=88.32 TRINITY_DN12166_c0_g1_i1:95-1447(+)